MLFLCYDYLPAAMFPSLMVNNSSPLKVQATKNALFPSVTLIMLFYDSNIEVTKAACEVSRFLLRLLSNGKFLWTLEAGNANGLFGIIMTMYVGKMLLYVI